MKWKRAFSFPTCKSNNTTFDI